MTQKINIIILETINITQIDVAIVISIDEKDNDDSIVTIHFKILMKSSK